MLLPQFATRARQICAAATVSVLATFAAGAQTPDANLLQAPPTTVLVQAESSSADGSLIALAAAPEPLGGVAYHEEGPYERQGPYNRRPSAMSHLAFEAGAGVSAPTPESSPYITWGGNATLGVGYRFNPVLSLMAEYQFIDDKLPGQIIAEAGAQGGNVHIWSLTLDPVVHLFPSSNNGVYLTGGGGFYRMVTSFTDPTQVTYCDYFYCVQGISNVVVGHYSSNQPGWSAGAGFEHTFGGGFRSGSAPSFFAEARYLEVFSPAVIAATPNGLNPTTVAANTKIIPVTIGVRF